MPQGTASSIRSAGAADQAKAGDRIVVTIKRPIIDMDEPWGYRNKAQLQVGRTNGELQVGLYARGETKRKRLPQKKAI
ncbi:hypothetical protein [Paenibacillus xanthanilyticus]|uniref:Uncharacterized protein n=1 Tax=Paenibacillus xanthanilyticus TaxID=1783531 RepID=A0ABV8K5M9_9BACL